MFIISLNLQRSSSKMFFIFQHGYVGEKGICNSKRILFACTERSIQMRVPKSA